MEGFEQSSSDNKSNMWNKEMSIVLKYENLQGPYVQILWIFPLFFCLQLVYSLTNVVQLPTNLVWSCVISGQI